MMNGSVIWLYILIATLTVGCNKNASQNQNNIVQSQNQTSTDVSIHFIDTGNSDAILIKQGEVAALIDGGDNDDETLVVDYLKAQGIKRLEYVIATHPDADHIGGLDAVITQLDVGQILVGNGKATTKTYTDFIEAIMDRGLSPSVPFLYSEFPLGQAVLKVVSVANEKDPNNCSLVILYTYGENKVLFMGDVDQSVEKSLDVKQIGDVDLIKVGHHGSKTSSNRDFIQAISPEYAVITCGTANKYGHPNQETLETLNAFKIAVYRTDEMGNIVFKLTDKELTPFTNLLAEENTQQVEDVKSQEADREVDKKPSSGEDEKLAQSNTTLTVDTKLYYTEKGTKYHLDPNCSGMKDPIEGTLETVGEREPCKKCFSILRAKR